MSDIRFPASLKPIVSKGYSQTRGSNVFRTSVTGGLPRQGRDVYFEAVPFSITLLTSSLGRQAFLSFLNNIHAGADSFIMPLDSGLGIQDHQVMITSTINDSTDDGLNWTFTFTITAERTAIQEDTCLTANLPDLFGCYGDCLGGFLKTYGVYQTTFPRIWSDEGPAGYPPINMQAQSLDDRIVYSGPSISYLNSAGLLASSAVNEWPLSFSSGASSGRVGAESQSENRFLYSELFSNSAWAGSTVTVSTGGASPNGSSLSQKIIPTSSGSSSKTKGQSIQGVVTMGQTYSISVYARSSGYNYLQFALSGGTTGLTTAFVNFDLTNGAIYNTSGLDVFSRSIGNGWWHCQASVVVTGDASVAKNVFFGVVPAANSARIAAFTGDGVSGIELWGAQIELSGKTTSYISTSATTTVRPAASASVFMNGATSIDITYSDASVVNVPAVSDYAPIPQANAAWGSKFITRIDFNV